MRPILATGIVVSGGRWLCELREQGGRRRPDACLAGSAVDLGANRDEPVGVVHAQVGAFREALAQQPVFSFVGRCQGEDFSQKNTAFATSVCIAISLPGSQDSERRRCCGTRLIAATSASRTASAVCRPPGTCSRIVNRLERSITGDRGGGTTGRARESPASGDRFASTG